MANIEATSDVYFSWTRNIALGPSNAEPNDSFVNLVATSNRYGLVFAAFNSDIKCTSIADLQKQHSVEKNLPDAKDHSFMTVPAGGVINGLFLSADDSVLAVCALKPNNLPFCHLFDIRAFGQPKGSPIGPFHSFPLANEPHVKVIDFAFNPVIVEMFAVVTSDGFVTNYEIGYQSAPQLKIHGKLQCGAVCCSWSPKGKQLVVAKTDGSLSQLKPQMVEAKAIPAPPNMSNAKPKAIHWAASTVFVTAYWSTSVDVIVTILQKNLPANYILFDEPCFRNLNEESLGRAWFCQVPKWNFLIMCCRNSAEVAVLKHSEDRLTWTYLDIEENRASLPMLKVEQSYPTGVAINFSSTIPVEKKNAGSKPPSPLLLISSTFGTLVPYYIINCSASEIITEAPQQLQIQGARRMLTPLQALTDTPKLGGDISKSKINLLKKFEKPEMNDDQKTETASNKLLPLNLQSQPAVAPTPQMTSMFANPPASQGTGMFGNLGSVTSTATSALPAFGAAAAPTSMFGLSGPTQTGGLFGLSAPISGAPTAPTSLAPAASVAAANTKSGSYNFSFGNVPSPSKPTASPLAQSTPFKPLTSSDPSTLPPLAAFSTLAKPVAVSTSIQSLPTSVPAPVSAPSLQTPAQDPKENQPRNLVQSHELEDPSSKKSQESLSRETLSRAFFNEMQIMTKELDAMKMEASKVLDVPIGSDQQLNTMRNDAKQLMNKMESVKSELKSMKFSVQEAEKVLLDALACATQLKRTTASKESRISRMDPVTETTLKQARALAQYLESQLVNANSVLDNAFEKYSNEKSITRRVPKMEMLCRTVLSCDKTIEALRADLDDIRVKVDGAKRLRNIREKNNEDLTSLADSMLKVGISNKDEVRESKKNKSALSSEKIKNLREYLAQRTPNEVTPTKSSAKGDSIIVSKLSTILEQSRIDAEKEKTSERKVSEVKKLSEPTNMPRESIGGMLGLRNASSNLQAATSTPIASKFAPKPTEAYKPICEPISPPPTKEDSLKALAGVTPCKPFSFAQVPKPTSQPNFSFSAPKTDLKLSFNEPASSQSGSKPSISSNLFAKAPVEAANPAVSDSFNVSMPPASSGTGFSSSVTQAQKLQTPSIWSLSPASNTSFTKPDAKPDSKPIAAAPTFSFSIPKDDSATTKEPTKATGTVVPISFSAAAGLTGTGFSTSSPSPFSFSAPTSKQDSSIPQIEPKLPAASEPEQPKVAIQTTPDKKQGAAIPLNLSEKQSAAEEPDKAGESSSKTTTPASTETAAVSIAASTSPKTATEPAVSTSKSLFSPNQTFNFGSTAPTQSASLATSTSTATSAAAPGTSIFAKPSTGLFGKTAGGGLFGSSSSGFGQGSTFGAAPATSFFGGSSTSANTSLFGTAVTTTVSSTPQTTETSSTSTIQAAQVPTTTTTLTSSPTSPPTSTLVFDKPQVAESAATSAEPASTATASESIFATVKPQVSASNATTTTSACTATPSGSIFATVKPTVSDSTTTTTTSASTATPSGSIFANVKPTVSDSTATNTSSASTTSPSGSIFATVKSTVSDSTATNTSSASTSSPSGSIFGSQVASSLSTTAATPAFGTQATFGQASAPGSGSTASSPQTTSVFGSAPQTSTPQSTLAFGSVSTTTGATSSPAFGSPAAQPSQAFGSGTSTSAQSSPAFGAVSPTSAQASPSFGGVNASINAAPPAFGGITPTSAAPAFGSATNNAVSPTFGFGNVATPPAPAFGSSAPAFGASSTTQSSGLFGQSSSNTTTAFGGSPAFGAQQQTPASNTGGGLFGKSFASNSGLFGQKSSFSSPAGNQVGSLFGGAATQGSGGFMSGLGQANATTPTKNVFGGGNFGQSNASQTNLFGSTGGASTFGGSPAFGQAAQSPTGTGSTFGAFSQNTNNQNSSFGKPPVFGSSPAGGFGAPATFGSSPSFSSPTSAFGSAASSESTAFANAANAPTFGSLAQSQQPSFASQAPAFGQSGFGAGNPQPPGFGGQPSSPPQGSAFTKYRG